MKKVTLKDLKQDLSLWTSRASKGEMIQITRYNKPYVYISAGSSGFMHVGTKVGLENLEIDASITKEASKGNWLKILQEDREDS